MAACLVVLAACGAGGADEGGGVTRNLGVTTTKPARASTTTMTTTLPATTQAPSRATLPGGLPAVGDIVCVPTGVGGGFVPSTLPRATLPGDGGDSSGLTLETSCDPATPPSGGSSTSPARVFLVEAPTAPTIRSVETIGSVDVRIVDGRRVWRQGVRVATDTIPVSSAMRADRLVSGRLEVRITQRGTDPGRAPDQPSLMRQQSTSGSRQIGVFDADSDNVAFEVRWAAQERREGGDVFRRLPSPWSSTGLAQLSTLQNDPFVLVGFGDSYGSGEGNPAQPADEYGAGCWSFWAYDEACRNRRPFEDSRLWDFHETGANELVWGTANACHRSSESGVAKAVEQLHEEWRIPQGSFYFGHFACSGAEGRHIVDASYKPDWTEGYPCRWTNPGARGTCKRVPAQITQARAWLTSHRLNARDVDVAVVSIGGNNAGFADLVAACFVLLDVCNDAVLASIADVNDGVRATSVVSWFYPDAVPTWRRSRAISALRTAVRSVATAVNAAFPRATIMFTTYTDGISVDPSNPADLDGDGVCSEEDFTSSSPYPDDWNWTISAQSARWLQGTMRSINATIEDEVARMQRSRLPVQVVSEQTDNHTNNGFCTGLANSSIVFSDEAAVTQGDDISDIADLSSGGWHPSDLGYQFYGEAIATAITATGKFARTWPMFDN